MQAGEKFFTCSPQLAVSRPIINWYQASLLKFLTYTIELVGDYSCQQLCILNFTQQPCSSINLILLLHSTRLGYHGFRCAALYTRMQMVVLAGQFCCLRASPSGRVQKRQCCVRASWYRRKDYRMCSRLCRPVWQAQSGMCNRLRWYRWACTQQWLVWNLNNYGL